MQISLENKVKEES